MHSRTLLLTLAIGLLSGSLFAQSNTNQSMSNQEIVKTFLNGFSDSSKIQESLALLAEDYQFTNPMVELKSKAEFIGLAQEIGAVLTGVEVLGTAENGEWVATMYIFKTAIPEVESNIASEWFRLENGLIQESRLIYDASAWRKIYAQMEK